jgi:hypothetical protein
VNPPRKPAPRLESWQSIAEYLGVSVRTAQKWEIERGLPVSRQLAARGKVSAEPADLDKWREATAEKPSFWDSPRLLRTYAGITAGILLLELCAAAGYAVHATGAGRRPARLSQEYDSVMVADERGRELWRYKFDDSLRLEEDQEEIPLARRASFGDLDGDGRIETLYAYVPASAEEKGASLYCFSETGKLRWSFRPGRSVHTAGASLDPPYAISYFGLLPGGTRGDARILVVSNHVASFPAQVALLDKEGPMLGEYWHSGPLTTVETGDLDSDGFPEIILGGHSSSYEAATLVVLDSRDVRGASTERESPKFQILGFEPGRERARLLFPRVGAGGVPEAHEYVSQIVLRFGCVRLEVRERNEGTTAPAQPGVVYALDERLRVMAVEASDEFWAQRRQLESLRKLRPGLEDADVKRLGGNVRTLVNLREGRR